MRAAPVDARAQRRTLAPVFRLSARADPAFLAEMLYEAVNWRDDGAEERPPFDEMLARPELRRYVEGWGRVGDVAIVALDRRDEPVGAAWYRLFRADEPGYGFVDDDTPELSIAVYPECRGQHVGGLLLGTLAPARAIRRVLGDQPERAPARTRPAGCTPGTASRSLRERGRLAHDGRRLVLNRFAVAPAGNRSRAPARMPAVNLRRIGLALVRASRGSSRSRTR